MKRGGKIFWMFILIALIFICAAIGHNIIIKKIYPQKYAEFVEKYSIQYGVDANLIYSVIKCESGFNPDANSNKEAKGLMQMRDDTFAWVQTKDPEATPETADIFDPETNIKYGTLLLSLHLKEFGDTQIALAAYHAGRSKVNTWLDKYSSDGKTLDKIPYKDTAHYINKVKNTKEVYDKTYKPERTE